MHPHNFARRQVPNSLYAKRAIASTPEVSRLPHHVMCQIAMDSVLMPSRFIHYKIKHARLVGKFDARIYVYIISSSPDAVELYRIHRNSLHEPPVYISQRVGYRLHDSLCSNIDATIGKSIYRLIIEQDPISCCLTLKFSANVIQCLGRKIFWWQIFEHTCIQAGIIP